MKPAVALALLFLLAPAALAAPLTISVARRNAEGEAKPVPGARVAVAPADHVTFAEPLLMASELETDERGRVVVDRPAGALLVVASVPAGSGIAWARAETTHREVSLVLPPAKTLSGLVLDPAGRPVAGAEVLAVPETGAGDGRFLAAGLPVLREYSDSAGRFFFFRSSDGARYRLRAHAPGFAPAVVRDEVAGDEPVELRLTVGATVRGLVLASPGGTLVPGAHVEIGGVEGDTSEEGRFDLRGVPAGRWRLSVTAAGHLSVEKTEIVLAEGEFREGIVVHVIGMGRIRGRVLTPATRPAAGAELFLRYPPDADIVERLPEGRLVRAGVADEQGRFDLRGLLPAQGVDLIARHPDYAPAVYLGYSIVAGVTFDSVILLRAGGTISGRVLDAGGEPLAGVSVLVLDDREDLTALLAGEGKPPPTARSTETGEDGVFAVAGLAAGKKAVLARKEGLLPGLVRGVEVGDRSRREGLLVHLGAGSHVAGRVLDGEGRPLAGARAVLVPPLGGRHEAVTGEDGRFLVDGIPAGPYFLRVVAPGFGTWEKETVRAPADGIEVRLVPSAGLTGRVLLESGEEGVPGATVRALLRGERDPLDPGRVRYREVARVRAEPPDGRYLLPDLEPGVYRVEAWGEDGSTGFASGIVVSADTTPPDLDLRLLPGWSVAGRVVRAGNGAPVEGALVAVRGEADVPGSHAVTDAQGHFRLPGLRPGFHTLVVTAHELAPAVVPGVEVRPAADTFVEDVVLSEGGLVRGVVVGPGGEARVGARIVLTSAELRGSREAVTDELGRFEFAGLAAGSYLLAYEDALAGPGGSRVERLLEVREEEELFVSVGTGEGTTLAGQITAAGVPVAHALLTAVPEEEAVREERRLYSTRSDAQGNYLLPDLPPGRILLLVQPAGTSYPPLRFPVDLLPGPVTVHDVFLAQSGIEGRVEDLDSGAPLAGANLVLHPDAGAEGTFLERLARETGEARSDAQGRFLLPALPPGWYRIEAWRDGYGRTEVPAIRVAPGGLTDVRVAMPPAGTLAGRVTTDDGRPASEARVAFLDARGRAATRDPWIPVDADGRFRVATLRTGVYTVEATAPGCARARAYEVSVFPGGHARVSLTLVPEGRMEITVYGLGGVPVEDARITVTDFWGHTVPFPAPKVGLRSPWRDPSRTDEAGRVRVANLPPGIYEVAASAEGLVGKPVRVRVLDGERARGAIVLRPRSEPR